MGVPEYTLIIEQFFHEALDPLLQNYVFNGYHTLASHLKIPLGLAVVLFIALQGINMMLGHIKLSVEDWGKSALKIGLIYTFAMNWSLFSQWGVEGIQGFAGQIGDWMVSATPIHLPQFAGTGIDGAMQSVFIEVTKVGSWVWDMGSWDHLAPCITAALIWIFGYVTILIALFEIVMSKIMLAVLFALAPLFIGFTLFKPTQGYFDRWLGAITGFAFVWVFVSAVLGLVLSFSQWAVGDMYLHQATGITLIGFIPSMLVGFLGIGIILKASSLAQSIGGAVSTASGTQMLSSAVGGFVGGAMGAASTGLNLGKGAIGGLKAFHSGINQVGGSLGKSAMQAGSKMNDFMTRQLRGGL